MRRQPGPLSILSSWWSDRSTCAARQASTLVTTTNVGTPRARAKPRCSLLVPTRQKKNGNGTLFNRELINQGAYFCWEVMALFRHKWATLLYSWKCVAVKTLLLTSRLGWKYGLLENAQKMKRKIHPKKSKQLELPWISYDSRSGNKAGLFNGSRADANI